MKMDIISKMIDFDKLSKPWFQYIPTLCKYNELNFKYNNKDNYDNSIIMEKNIHFIWIGSVINDKYMNTVINCKKINVNYSIYLWIDENTLTPDILDIFENNNIITKNIYNELINDELELYVYNQIQKFNNYGYKADIIRLYIVYKYGGIYSDIDSVWLKPFDENFQYEFVAYRIDSECSDIGNPFFGFCKNSIILLDFLQNLEKSIDCIMKINDNNIIQANIPIMTGGGFISKILIDNKYNNLNYMHQAYCVIGGPHENLYSSFSKEGKSYCYQTFDKNWC